MGCIIAGGLSVFVEETSSCPHPLSCVCLCGFGGECQGGLAGRGKASCSQTQANSWLCSQRSPGGGPAYSLLLTMSPEHRPFGGRSYMALWKDPSHCVTITWWPRGCNWMIQDFQSLLKNTIKGAASLGYDGEKNQTTFLSFLVLNPTSFYISSSCYPIISIQDLPIRL